eukprot:6213781-Pleurochrysis_carterae.AAC.2
MEGPSEPSPAMLLYELAPHGYGWHTVQAADSSVPTGWRTTQETLIESEGATAQNAVLNVQTSEAETALPRPAWIQRLKQAQSDHNLLDSLP